MTVGELIVKLGVDTAEYERGLNRMEKRTQVAGTKMGDVFYNLGKRLGSVGKSISMFVTGPIMAAGAGIFALAQKTANAGDVIQKMALRTGFSTETLSEYKHAAELSGTSLDALEKGVKRMQKSIYDAERGLSTANEALDFLGLSIEDLQGLSPEQQFDKMAMALADIEDPSKRAALAQEIFGRAGTEMLPMLSAGADGIVAMRQEARDLGVVFSQEAADAAADFNDNMLRLKMAFSGAFMEVGQNLLPIITEQLIPALRESLIPAIKQLGEKLIKLIKWFAGLNSVWQKVILGAIGLFAAIGPVMLALSKLIRTVQILGIALLRLPVGFVTRALQIYQLQLHLASMAGIAHVGVLQILRTALYSVFAAMGPLGWAIMAVSAAVTGGIIAWSKYAASVEQANLQKVLGAVSGESGKVADSSQQTAEGLQEQADATKKAGKAAKDNLQPFDEINRLMSDAASSAEEITAGLDQMTIPSPPALEAPAAPALPDVSKMLEAQKPTLAGFWEWIKQEVASLWNWLKEKWGGIGDWAAGIWDNVKGKWIGFKEWVIDWSGPLWDVVKQKWASFAGWASSLWDAVKSKWGRFGIWVEDLWDNIHTKANIKWQKIVKMILDWWDGLKQGISDIWADISNDVSDWWDGFKRTADSKWKSVTDTISTWWDNLRQSITTKWNYMSSYLGSAWDNFRIAAGNKWNNIKNAILSAWQNMKVGMNSIWSNIVSSTNNYAGQVRSIITNKLEQSWDYIKSIPSRAYWWGRDIIDRLIDGIKSLRIPTPHFSFSISSKSIAGISLPVPDIDVRWYGEGGIFTRPAVIGVGERGPEALLPLSDTSWMDKLAERIAAALRTTQLAGAGDIYVYIGNEQVEAYIYRAQERRNLRSNGR